MSVYQKNIEEAVIFLKQRLKPHPEIAIITGTGLNTGITLIDPIMQLDYRQIPHFPQPSVQSHSGLLLLGELGGCPAVILQGRFHLYEGFSAQEVVFPIRVLQLLGVKNLFITNAAGGLDPAFEPGDTMLITDHINLTGFNPLTGPQVDSWGPRFPNMHAAYSAQLRQLALTGAQHLNLKLQQGVYAGLAGPALETPAEVRFLRTIGAQAVGFSTVMEVIAAAQGGMQVLGLSCLTNVHDPDHPAPADVADIIATASQSASLMMQLMVEVADRI